MTRRHVVLQPHGNWPNAADLSLPSAPQPSLGLSSVLFLGQLAKMLFQRPGILFPPTLIGV